MVQKVTVKHEFEAGLRHATTGKVCQPSSKWVLIRIRRKERGWAPSFIRSETLTPAAPTAIRLWKPLPFKLDNSTFKIKCTVQPVLSKQLRDNQNLLA